MLDVISITILADTSLECADLNYLQLLGRSLYQLFGC